MSIEEPTLFQNYVAHVKGDFFARYLKDWQNAERHQASARDCAAQLFDYLGDYAAKTLMSWRNEALAEARRELPELDRQIAEAQRLLEEVK